MTPELYRQRRDAALISLGRLDLDVLLVTHLANVRYLTGFTGSAGALVLAERETVLLSDFRYRTQAEQEVGPELRVEIASSDMWSLLWKVLQRDIGVGRLGFEEHHVSAHQARRFAEAAAGVHLVPCTGLVETLRASKAPEEVAAIREAAEIACDALQAVLEVVSVGHTELEVAGALERELRIRGSLWHPFPTIVASGPRSALPHAGTESREICSGDLLLLDFGAQVSGYCADVTRTVVVGRRADEKQKMVYELVREAQRVAREGIVAGMSGKDADSLARSLIESHGFGDAFGHSLGHGLGLEVHEDPRISQSNDEPLPEGSVVTIEPGVYLPGFGGVRLEDDVYLGREGGDILSDGRTELTELT